MSAKQEDNDNEEPAGIDEGSSAHILLEELSGKIDDEKLGCMVLAGLIVEDDGKEPRNCPEGTSAIMREIRQLNADESFDARRERVAGFGPEAKTVVVAGIISEMEENARIVTEREAPPPNRHYLEQYGTFLAHVLNSGGVMAPLPRRMAEAFNSLAKSGVPDVALHRAGDGAFYLKRDTITRKFRLPS